MDDSKKIEFLRKWLEDMIAGDKRYGFNPDFMRAIRDVYGMVK